MRNRSLNLKSSHWLIRKLSKVLGDKTDNWQNSEFKIKMSGFINQEKKTSEKFGKVDWTVLEQQTDTDMRMQMDP